MCLLTWNWLQTHMWHHLQSLLRLNWKYKWFRKNFLIWLVHFFTHPPIFLPVHKGFYPSKWQVDRSLHKAMVDNTTHVFSCTIWTFIWQMLKIAPQNILECKWMGINYDNLLPLQKELYPIHMVGDRVSRQSYAATTWVESTSVLR